MQNQYSVKVAVIIVNYNGIDDTRESIESILRQQVETEIIVVDNASARCEGREIEKEYQKAKVIFSEKNVGFAGGNNLGIKYALGKGTEYILLLNNDTVIDKNMITNLLAEADSTTVAVPAMYFHSEPDALWYGGGIINKWTGNVKHMNWIKKRRCDFATGCCMLIHRDILETIGKMDESFFMYCEDVDYSIRIKKAGIVLKYVPAAKLWHKVGKTSGGNESALSIYYNTRNRLACIKKHKSYFYWSAYPYSVLTRYIRMYQLKIKGRPEWKAYKKGMGDYQKGINGKAGLLM